MGSRFSIYSFSHTKVHNKAKENGDYYECIKRAHEGFKFDYLLVLEDDAELSDGELERLLKQLDALTAVTNKRQLYMIKLFHNSYLDGFGLECESLKDLLVTPLLVQTIYHIIITKCLKLKSDLYQNAIGFWFAIQIIRYLFIMFLMYSLGRQNSILCLRKLLNTPNAHHLQIPAQSGKQIHTFGLYLK